MNRILFETGEISTDGSVWVPRNDFRAHHMRKVLKLGEEDRFRAGVVNGRGATGTITSAGPKGYTLRLTLEQQPALPRYPIALLLAHPRPIVLKRMLRDLTTAGLGELIVFPGELGERSYLMSSLWESGSVRRLLMEGAMQGGSTMIPEVHQAASLESAVGSVAGRAKLEGRRLLFADEEGGGIGMAGLVGEERPDSAGVVAAIGPERGWSDAERSFFISNGFEPLSLGERVLRTEAAAIVTVCTLAARYATLGLTGERIE